MTTRTIADFFSGLFSPLATSRSPLPLHFFPISSFPYRSYEKTGGNGSAKHVKDTAKSLLSSPADVANRTHRGWRKHFALRYSELCRSSETLLSGTVPDTGTRS